MCFVIPSRGMSFVNIVCTKRGNGAVGALFAWCNPIKNLHHTPALITSISSKNPTLCHHHRRHLYASHQVGIMDGLVGLAEFTEVLGIGCCLPHGACGCSKSQPITIPWSTWSVHKHKAGKCIRVKLFLFFNFSVCFSAGRTRVLHHQLLLLGEGKQIVGWTDGRTDGKYQQLHWMIGVCLQTSSLMAKVQSCHLA